MDILKSLSRFIENSKHVMSVSHKPGRHDCDKAAKIIILGIVLIGVLGLIIAIIVSLIITGSLALI
jgi:protein translocase SEC61 complex gamma subunit